MNIHKHAPAPCAAFSAVGQGVANCKLVNGALNRPGFAGDLQPD